MTYKARAYFGSFDEEVFLIKTLFVLSESELRDNLYLVENNKVYAVDRNIFSNKKEAKDVSFLFSEETLAKLLLKLTLSDEDYFGFTIYPN